MSLLDALLLDPVRVNFWIADRNDGIAGSGTQMDPYDGSTLPRFDSVMYTLSQRGEAICIHLGPGTFETAGYYDGIGGTHWEAKPGMRIVGSGIDVTTIKLVSAATTQRAYAIGHALSANTVGAVRVEVHEGAGAVERPGRSRRLLLSRVCQDTRGEAGRDASRARTVEDLGASAGQA